MKSSCLEGIINGSDVWFAAVFLCKQPKAFDVGIITVVIFYFMESDKKREFNWIWIVVGLFLAETVFRFLCSNFPIGVRTYKDELNYFQIAKSIWNSHSLSVYGIGTRFQKILYPILISPAFAIGNSYVRMKVINLLNSAIMSSSVFPGFLFAKKISNNNIILCRR